MSCPEVQKQLRNARSDALSSQGQRASTRRATELNTNYNIAVLHLQRARPRARGRGGVLSRARQPVEDEAKLRKCRTRWYERIADVYWTMLTGTSQGFSHPTLDSISATSNAADARSMTEVPDWPPSKNMTSKHLRSHTCIMLKVVGGGIWKAVSRDNAGRMKVLASQYY